mmetsp:Transcript_1084/g.2452  ORF Transcript_1084/g.2452 Transcript_1084/m.2452 type:complete len:440 (-) Transcript_1084:410-1729(-)|eukprot:CAMPEP_0202365764 /NCGR_PEP_ID=MMETSP1126-20121109/16654_1 /ASSEMBLY_ACC=CAM_ASM_000457 /TAXON_ID=3047 /ORGANISM="Dunaliella tertiolecta, Strain CCMP1320" /LENGTH=439 /DNA_ID=CAMNT_0048960697 /DNA_START=24 /DNA_END=1343 /DNA_ORIENTATION=-
MVGRGKRKQPAEPAEQHQPLKYAGRSSRGRGRGGGIKGDSVPASPAGAGHEEGEEPERGQGEPSTSYGGSSSDGEQSSDQEAAQGTDPQRVAGRGREARRASAKAESQGSLPARRSFADIVAGKLEDETLKSLLRSLPQKRATERQHLLVSLRAAQPQWLLMLRAGFSLVFYGLGSKKDLLQDFARSVLMENGALVTVNGYVPSLSAYQIVAATVFALSGKVAKSCGNTAKDMIDYLHREAAQHAARSCFVVVHNIDGPGLRAESEQVLLANLARCPSVHMLASIDHVNAPLLWSKAMEAKFKWLWIDVTTYAPYIAETLDKPSILAGTFQQARQRGAGAVLRSMVPNAREVFGLLVAHQLEDPESEGLDFKLLFRMCRERYLLTSEAALKTHITEFTDHQLLAARRSSEGAGEVMYVPMDAAGLQKVAEELEAIKSGA